MDVSDKNKFRVAAEWLRNLAADATNAAVRLEDFAAFLETNLDLNNLNPTAVNGLHWAIGKVLFCHNEQDLAWKRLEEICKVEGEKNV